MVKYTKRPKSCHQCRHWWRTAPCNRTKESGHISKPPDHPIAIRNASSFFHNSLEKKGVDLPVFNCNSHLIGRGIEIFVAQDSYVVWKALPPSLHKENKVTPSSPPLVQGTVAFPPCTSLTLPVRGRACFAEHQLCSSEIWGHQKWLNCCHSLQWISAVPPRAG